MLTTFASATYASYRHNSPSNPTEALPSCHDKSSLSIDEVDINPQASLDAQKVTAFPRRARTIPPFILTHDVPRGMIYAFQALLGYALMLAVMWVAFLHRPNLCWTLIPALSFSFPTGAFRRPI